MLVNICYVITVVILLVFLHVHLTRQLHILQQSFYHPSDFLRMMKGNKIDKISVIMVVVAILLELLAKDIFKIGLLIVWNLSAILAIKALLEKKKQVKKKFAITTRIKITYGMYYGLICCMGVIAIISHFPWKIGIDTLLCMASIEPFFTMLLALLSNLIAFPILYFGNQKYIKEAKKIIASKPEMKIVGITGSYGKTSTKNIVTQILSEKYHTVMTPQSYNTTLGVVKTIRENIKPYTEVFVCEMGASRVGDIKEICNIATPDYSVITSIGPQHLSSFKSIENVVKGKFEIVQYAKENATMILNMDQKLIEKNSKRYKKRIITYSLKNSKCSYFVKNISMNEKGSSFNIHAGKEVIPIQTKLLGKHNITNILCAVAIAKDMGMSNEEIRRAVKKILPIEHRLELKQIGEFLALDDSFNSNPEGSKMAIECLNMFQEKYKVLVTPGMVELGEKEYELNKKFGEYATKCDYVILVGEKTTKAIRDGMDELHYIKYEVVDTLYKALDQLKKIKEEHPNLIVLFENDLPDCYS